MSLKRPLGKLGIAIPNPIGKLGPDYRLGKTLRRNTDRGLHFQTSNTIGKSNIKETTVNLMTKYLNGDSMRGWLAWFQEQHWVSSMPKDVRIPATVINRSTVQYGMPFIVVRSQAPENFSKMLIDRMTTGKPMWPTLLGEPPMGMRPTDVARHVSRHGLWIDPQLELNASSTTLMKLAHALVLKNGLANATYGIFGKLLSGNYPGVRFHGPAVNLGGVAA